VLAVGTAAAGRRSTMKANGAATSMSPPPIEQCHVQAVDEGVVHERFGSRTECLRYDAALSPAHILDDVRDTCLGCRRKLGGLGCPGVFG
jgi:hypothetical protein